MIKAITKTTRTLSDIQFQLLMDAQTRQDRAEAHYRAEVANLNNIRALVFDALDIEPGSEASLDIQTKKLTLVSGKSKTTSSTDAKKSA